jgi:hypothetical protein
VCYIIIKISVDEQFAMNCHNLYLSFDNLRCVHFLTVGMDEEDDPSATLFQVLNDTKRVGYFKGYLASVAQAIK